MTSPTAQLADARREERAARSAQRRAQAAQADARVRRRIAKRIEGLEKHRSQLRRRRIQLPAAGENALADRTAGTGMAVTDVKAALPNAPARLSL